MEVLRVSGQVHVNKPLTLEGNIKVATFDSVVPTGTINITENGSYDVFQYANAEVDVEGLVPSGTLNITENGTYDVTEYAEANVNVSASIEPYVIQSNERVTVNVVKEILPTLPTGYTQVEYIESHGTEYIDTGVLMDTTSTGKTAQFSFMMLERGVQPYYVGARVDSTNSMTFLTTYYGTPSWNYTNKSGSGSNLAINRVYEIQCELRSGWQALNIDGANQSQGTNAGTVTSSINFYAFARNNNGTADGLSKIRLYGLVIRNGNQTARKLCDLIPCIQDSTGEYGMYDLVTNTFKGNLGTGAFTGGAEMQNYSVSIEGFSTSDETKITENLGLIFESVAE